METKPNFSLTEKCFSLTNFSNGKQTHKSLENNFLKTMRNKDNFNLYKFLYLIKKKKEKKLNLIQSLPAGKSRKHELTQLF